MKFMTLMVLAGVLLSNDLMEDILKNLASQPYAMSAPIIGKIQNEAQHQPPPITCPEPKPQEPAK
jgi:hypothetical protein